VEEAQNSFIVEVEEGHLLEEVELIEHSLIQEGLALNLQGVVEVFN